MATRTGVYLNLRYKRDLEMKIVKFMNSHVNGEGSLKELSGYICGQLDVQWDKWNFRSFKRDEQCWHLVSAAATSDFDQKKFLFFLNETAPLLILEPGKIIAASAYGDWPTKSVIYWLDENRNVCYRDGYIYNENPAMNGPWTPSEEDIEADKQYLQDSPWNTPPTMTYGGETNLSIPGTANTQHYKYVDSRPTMSPKQELKRIAMRQHNERYETRRRQEAEEAKNPVPTLG